MEDLEGPDDTITLQRAAQIAGLTLHTLSDAARAGRLAAIRPGHDWLTTRRGEAGARRLSHAEWRGTDTTRADPEDRGAQESSGCPRVWVAPFAHDSRRGRATSQGIACLFGSGAVALRARSSRPGARIPDPGTSHRDRSAVTSFRRLM
jgi:hypothetical protein